MHTVTVKTFKAAEHSFISSTLPGVLLPNKDLKLTSPEPLLLHPKFGLSCRVANHG